MARFSATHFSTVGLAPQTIVLTLTATDANGDIVSDTVVHRIDQRFRLIQSQAFVLGVPDEIVGGVGLDQRQTPFTLPAGLTRVVGTLSWPDATGVQDVDLRFLDPAGNDATGAQGATSSNPEVVAVDAPAAGTWTAQVEPFASGRITTTLTIEASPGAILPTPQLVSGAVFGRTDAQALRVAATGGSAPYAFSWDLDQDGFYEVAGDAAATSFGAGAHTVRARVTDATGFEVGLPVTVDVREADTILRLRCGNDATTPYWAMEFSSSKGSCWIHGGHHTYFFGDTRFALRALVGYVFTVEQQLSPPTEHNTDTLGTTPLHVQVSEDGITWVEVAHGEYRFAGLEQRQRVDIAASVAAEPFRFLRIHEPLSAAQGLSGYLDHSEFDVEADVLGAVPIPAVASGSRALSCATDILEDFFVTHPCTFGGVDRWDAPSFYHTYPTGDGASLDRVQGSFTLAPWRLDDWSDGDARANATNVHAYLQTSVDGVSWTNVAQIDAEYGVPAAFDIALGGEPARFVRLFPAYHARFDAMGDLAANHHPKGFFLDSSLVVHGLLPP